MTSVQVIRTPWVYNMTGARLGVLSLLTGETLGFFFLRVLSLYIVQPLTSKDISSCVGWAVNNIT